MTDQPGLPPISNDELLARFVLFNSRIRADGTVKPDAFMPPPNLDLSVTRHALASTAELIWKRGRVVATSSEHCLVGRADVLTDAVRKASPLDTVPAPLPDDKGHAHIVGWPAEKAGQKILALQVANASTFVQAPTQAHETGDGSAICQ